MSNKRHCSLTFWSMLWLAASTLCVAAPTETFHTKERICRGMFGIRRSALFARGGAVEMSNHTTIAEHHPAKVGTIDEVDAIISESISGNSLVVIYFTAQNCPPCKMIAPIYEELSNSEEFEERGVKFLKVNVTENPDTAAKFNVDGWPTFILIKGGEKQDEIVGGNAAKLGLYDMVTKYA